MRKSSIVYRQRSRVAVLHEDLLEICDGNMLAAMLLSILIYWTDVKLAHHEQECEQAKASGASMPVVNLWIWKSHEGFQHDLMNDKDGMRKVHRSTIASALKLLKDKQFITIRRNPQNNIDQTRQYHIERQTIQESINALPPLFDSLKTDTPLSEIRLSNVGNDAMDCTISDNALPKNRQAIPEITTRDYYHEITNKDEATKAQSATAIAPHIAALSEQKNPVSETPVQEPPPKPKRTRKPKPKAEPVNAEEEARITAVFDTFDAIARECFRDPEYRYARPKTDADAIRTFLALSPTPTVEKLKTHYRYLFKRPKSKDGFLWSENMTIAAVLRDYGRKPKAPTMEETKPTGYVIDEERNARNKARLHEEAEKIRAARAAGLAQQKPQEAHYAISR